MVSKELLQSNNITYTMQTTVEPISWLLQLADLDLLFFKDDISTFSMTQSINLYITFYQ